MICNHRQSSIFLFYSKQKRDNILNLYSKKIHYIAFFFLSNIAVLFKSQRDNILNLYSKKNYSLYCILFPFKHCCSIQIIEKQYFEFIFQKNSLYCILFPFKHFCSIQIIERHILNLYSKKIHYIDSFSFQNLKNKHLSLQNLKNVCTFLPFTSEY